LNRQYAPSGGRSRRPSRRERERKRQRRILLRKGIVLGAALVLVTAIVLLIRGCTQVVEEARHSYQSDWEYAPLAYRYAEEYDVPVEIVFAVIETESHFSVDAQSGVGACGLMQLMPDTYEWIRLRLGEEQEPISTDAADSDSIEESSAEEGTSVRYAGGIFDPETNIRYGVYYLSYLYDLFNNWETVYAGYNAGPSIVRSWLQDERYSADGVTLSSIPYTETANYVVKVSSARERYAALFSDSDDQTASAPQQVLFLHTKKQPDKACPTAEEGVLSVMVLRFCLMNI
jgi:soluble lytic murein transglycosylase